VRRRRESRHCRIDRSERRMSGDEMTRHGAWYGQREDVDLPTTFHVYKGEAEANLHGLVLITIPIA
jgi:hypothetical protein